jgi:elongation factor Ts
MAEITAALVKELREASGAGMMDCKKALIETDGNVEAAVDWLRTKGLSAAAKKSGRIAAEGLVGLSVGGNTGAIAEINSETDFVARNEQFQEFVSTVTGLALANEGDQEAVRASGYPGSDRTVEEELTQLIATIGENMSVRRMAALSVENGAIGSYTHNAVASNLGKIGVLVALESEGKADVLEALGKHLAMHIAWTNPQALDVDSLDPKLVERERNVQTEKARESGKPEEIIEKMLIGRMRKFYEEVVLSEQVSVVDSDNRISQVLELAAKDAGAEIVIKGFIRYELGEGLEKKEEDFAAEVREAVGG